MTINLEDLTPDMVVMLKPSKVRTVKTTGFVVLENDCASGTFTVHWLCIESIISRPEPDAEKIARLEAELAKQQAILSDAIDGFCRAAEAHRTQLAERDARIDELVAKLTTRPNPLIGEPTCYDEDRPTTRWSKPIEGPPPKGLPAGSYGVKFSEHGGWTEGGTPSDGIYQSTGIRHRIAMNTPITWEGGQCPVPGDWLVNWTCRHGRTHEDTRRAALLRWYHVECEHDDHEYDITTFTLTSDGE